MRRGFDGRGNRSGMKILIIGEDDRPQGLAEALETEGVDVVRPPKDSLPEAATDEVAQIAGGLIAFEKLFADDPPDAVLLVSTSNLALAGVLVATKIRIPVAALGTWTQDQAGLSELNRRLIVRLADGTVADDRPTITASLRDLAAV
jgi:UDP-N-acetylglucosamine 2-epimerase